MRSLERSSDEPAHVRDMELFFDLVFVFAITQLSHHLLAHPTVPGALQTALLLAMVWLLWAYTMWVTNWLDSDLMPVRLLLIALMLAGLAFSVALPQAFGARGLLVGTAYAAMQIGRSGFTVLALRTEGLRRNYQRITAWCLLSGAAMVAGGLAHGHAREALWTLGVAIDVGGGALGFHTPGLGRSRTTDWTVDPGHIAERCRLFVIIALGESIIITGGTVSDEPRLPHGTVAAFVLAFAGSVALWWIYFDRTAADAEAQVDESGDPGRLARSAYHGAHPLMVAGIIVGAAGDEVVILHPAEHLHAAQPWFVAGGAALFLLGHAAFKWLVWHVVPISRLVGAVVLLLLVAVGGQVTGAVLGGCVLAVLLAVVVADRAMHPSRGGDHDRSGDAAIV